MLSKSEQAGRYSKAQKGRKIQQSIKLADKWFSKYIRTRDAYSNGYAKCITCGKVDLIINMHCGHFVTRNHYHVRWDERNANVQCCHCNTYCSGEQHKHGEAIDKKWGEGTAEYVKNLGWAKGWRKVSQPRVEEYIKEYKAKYKELVNKNGKDMFKMRLENRFVEYF